MHLTVYLRRGVLKTGFSRVGQVGNLRPIGNRPVQDQRAVLPQSQCFASAQISLSGAFKPRQ